MNDEMWERTNDIKGHRPKFNVWCRFCDTDMVMRFSCVFPKPNLLHGFTEAGNQIAFKCPRCGYHVRFNIPDDREYIEEIHKLRGGKGHYNDVEDWSEDEAIAKQLENLGYFGGRSEILEEERNG